MNSENSGWVGGMTLQTLGMRTQTLSTKHVICRESPLTWLDDEPCTPTQPWQQCRRAAAALLATAQVGGPFPARSVSGDLSSSPPAEFAIEGVRFGESTRPVILPRNLSLKIRRQTLSPADRARIPHPKPQNPRLGHTCSAARRFS
jgi:hypothetical protein